MRLIKAIVFLALVASVVYLWFFRAPSITINNQTAPVPEAPIRRLSAFVDEHMDAIFKPLDSKDSIMPSQEIRQIRQSLEDLKSRSHSDRDKKLYSIGISLCIGMLQAIQQREAHCKRLADLQRRGSESLIGKEDAKKKQAFFETSVHRSWEAYAAKVRLGIERDYDQMRLLER